MKTIARGVFCGIVCSLCVAVMGCENNRNNENNKEVTAEGSDQKETITVKKTGKTAEERLAELKEWMAEKKGSGDTSGTESSSTKEEFKTRTSELDSKFDSLSERSRAEYEQLKERYNQWENRQERRQQAPLQADKINQWQEQLLREYKDLNKVTPENVREAYLTFIGVVRAKRQNWTQNDWDYVDHVYGTLNQRKREIEAQISTSDRVKIKALQTEYLTLEGVADTRSMMRSVKD